MLTLCADADAGIRRHGRETYPYECCGALIGRGGRVAEALALPNTTAEGPRRRFRVGPADYRAAERRADALGADLVGFYHSHRTIRRARRSTTWTTPGRCSPT